MEKFPLSVHSKSSILRRSQMLFDTFHRESALAKSVYRSTIQSRLLRYVAKPIPGILRTNNFKVLPYKHQTRFSGQKSFLLIGCLGGLGGAIAKWMVAQGARRLVFMGRSGTDRPVAKNLVADLRSLGADITVVKGDVVNFADVQKAVDSISGILGGVIQAAMGLDVGLLLHSICIKC